MRIRLLDRQTYATGWNPWVLLSTLRNLPAFLRDVRRYQNLGPPSGFQISMDSLFPILTDRTASAGFVGGHYFYQDLWAARKIFDRNPLEHIDIGSRIDGFIAHLLTFRSVTAVDIRPLASKIPGLTFVQDDATSLDRFADRSIESLSSLHVAEHFGLGRYGDPIDPHACFRFMSSLERVLAPQGRLYFSVPIGRERVEFNAHRVFAPQSVIDAFPRLKLVSFAFVGDDDCFLEDVDPRDIPASELACGLFEFTKPVAEPSSQHLDD